MEIMINPTTPIREAEKLLDVLLEHYIDGDGYCEGKDRKRAIQAITKHTERAVLAELENIPTEWPKIKITDAEAYHLLRQEIYNRRVALKTQLESKDG